MENYKFKYVPLILAIVTILGITLIQLFSSYGSSNQQTTKNIKVSERSDKLVRKNITISNDLNNRITTIQNLDRNINIELQSSDWSSIQRRNNLLRNLNDLNTQLSEMNQLKLNIESMNQELSELKSQAKKLEDTTTETEVPYLPKLVISIIILMGSFITIIVKSVPKDYKKIANSLIIALIGFWFGITL